MAAKLGIFLLIIGNIASIKAQPTITSLLSPSWSHCVHNLHAIKTRWEGFTSPNFPNGITTQTQCSWIITANPYYRVRISYHTMNLTGSTNNCYTQYVEIIDITAGSSQGKECGARRPRDYVSQGTKLRIDLKADTAATNHKGFSIKYIATRDRPGFKTRPKFNLPRPARRGRPGGAGSAPSAGGGAASAGGRVNLNQLQNRRRGNQGRPNARRPTAAAGAAGAGAARVVSAGAPAGASGSRVAPGSPAAPAAAAAPTRSSLFRPVIRRRLPAAAAPIQNHPSVHQN
uniref:CUB domain-containing protein n=3 Tax=Ciona intestinalis TaxID=7719 RepID=F7B206_CIOIN